MNGTAQAVADYAAAWPDAPSGIDVVVCPPWAYLDRMVAALRDEGVRFGVQTTAIESAGAFTGEHAAEMARDLGAEFAIVGHSERRRLYAETDAVVVAKMLAAQRAGLTPIVCVGETLEERRGGNAAGVVLAQLDTIETGAGPSAWEDVVIAYEPVWAIGTGETATPAQAQEMHVVIREYLARRSSRRRTSTGVWLAAHRSWPGSSPAYALRRLNHPLNERLGFPPDTANCRVDPFCAGEAAATTLDPERWPNIARSVRRGPSG